MTAQLDEQTRAASALEEGWLAAERLEVAFAEATGRAEAAASEAGALAAEERALAVEVRRLRALGDLERGIAERRQADLATSLAKAEAAKATVSAEIEGVHARLGLAEQELRDAHAHAAALRLELDRSVSAHRNALRQSDAALAELATIKSSTTWRASSVLRQPASRHPTLARASRRALRLAWWTATMQLPSRYRQWRRLRNAKTSLPAPEAVLDPPEVVQHVLLPAPVSEPEPIAPEPEIATVATEPPVAPPEASACQGWMAQLENRLLVAEAWQRQERERLDWALGAAEGVASQIDEYHSARDTPGFQAAFLEPDPLVSVCIATVDRSGTLIERAVASVRAQTHRNLQIVVAGDDCRDDTAQRLARLRDDRIVFVNLPERGPYPAPGRDRWYVAGTNAMNHALALCKGSWITHLDDDDRMTGEKIATMLAAARRTRSDFLSHAFWYEGADGLWTRLGRENLQIGQVTTGSIFYHQWFARFPWDVRAYRLAEPGDWNRLRRIKMLRPRLHFVDLPLMYHHAEQSQPDFIRRDGERFLG